jgi:hypothetical protein
MLSLCILLSLIRVLEFWELGCRVFWGCVAGRGSMVALGEAMFAGQKTGGEGVEEEEASLSC